MNIAQEMIKLIEKSNTVITDKVIYDILVELAKYKNKEKDYYIRCNKDNCSKCKLNHDVTIYCNNVSLCYVLEDSIRVIDEIERRRRDNVSRSYSNE